MVSAVFISGLGVSDPVLFQLLCKCWLSLTPYMATVWISKSTNIWVCRCLLSPTGTDACLWKTDKVKNTETLGLIPMRQTYVYLFVLCTQVFRIPKIVLLQLISLIFTLRNPQSKGVWVWSLLQGSWMGRKLNPSIYKQFHSLKRNPPSHAHNNLKASLKQGLECSPLTFV